MLAYPNDSRGLPSDDQSSFVGLIIPTDAAGDARLPTNAEIREDPRQPGRIPTSSIRPFNHQSDTAASARPTQNQLVHSYVPPSPSDIPGITGVISPSSRARSPSKDLVSSKGIYMQCSLSASRSSSGASLSPSSPRVLGKHHLDDFDTEGMSEIEKKRRLNMLAARRSRQRKTDHVHALEDQVEELRGQLNLRDQALLDAQEEIAALRRDLHARENQQSSEQGRGCREESHGSS